MNDYNADQAFDDALDMDEIAGIEEQGLLPGGTYITTPPGKHTMFSNDDGGRIYSYFFKVDGEKVEARGAVRVKLAFDKQLNAKGKVSWASTLGATAVRAYIAATGEKPKTATQVTEYLDNYPVRLSIAKMEGTDEFPPSNLVRQITAVRL